MPKITPNDLNPVKAAPAGGPLGDIEKTVETIVRMKKQLESLGIKLPGAQEPGNPQKEIPPQRRIVENQPAAPGGELDGVIKVLTLLCSAGKGESTLGEWAAELSPMKLNEVLDKLKKFKGALGK